MQINLNTMTREELREYIKENRNDQQAFYAYMDKLSDQPILATHSLNDDQSLEEIINKIEKTKHNISSS